MSTSSKKPLLFLVIGLAIGGLLGGVGGYVINDLTSQENEEVMAEIEEEQQTQEELDDLFNEIGAQPRAAAPAEGSSTSL